ncbi:restriction endonuclease subunit S [Psychrobacter aquimaris]|uniref:restriction endonuclease subunit S n=1 Tax=Psychrobacter aquimaris TaxID=292733 RepID=UPI003FD27BD4
MASDWMYLQLKDVIDLVADNRGRNPESYSNEGIPVIDNYLIISEGYVNLNEVKRCVDERTYESFIRKHIQENDVLITLVGNGYGQVALTPSEKCVIIQNTIGLRCNSDNDNIFLYYLLKNNRKALMNLNIGAAQPSIKVGNLTSLEFQFPPLSEQKAIAHILGSLDDKIELNRQMNETLEAMAQALFKSWFVDFDPVLDNALAAGKPIPDVFIERAEQRKGIEKKDNSEIQSLFPDEFEFTEEMGWIPKGWEVKPLDEVANYLNGLALQKYRPENIDDDYLPVVKIAQLREGLANHDEKASINIKPEYIIDNGDVIFSWSGSLLVDVWCGGKAALNQHLFKVTSGEYPKWFYLNYTKYHLAEFQRIATDKAVTMGHIKRGHLKEALCVIPENRVDDNVFAVFEDILNKQISSRIESQTIAKLRDTLLPKLMSGELRIPDAAALVDEAI